MALDEPASVDPLVPSWRVLMWTAAGDEPERLLLFVFLVALRWQRRAWAAERRLAEAKDAEVDAYLEAVT